MSNTEFETALKNSENEYYQVLQMIDSMYGGDVDPSTWELFKDELNDNVGCELLHVSHMYDAFGIKLDPDFTQPLREIKERVLSGEYI